MIKSLIAPLLFSTLVVGIAGHGDEMARVGRLALRAAVYFEIVTTLGLVVGLVAVNVVKPGVGVNLPPPTGNGVAKLVASAPTLAAFVEHMVPTSIIKAAADNEILQIVFFAIVFAVGLAKVPGQAKATMLALCESVSATMFRFVDIVMKFAPLGIGGAIAATVGHSGVGVLRNLAVLVATLYGSLLAFALVVLLPIAVLAKVPVRRFLSAIKEPWIIAFSTASSEAAFPLALERMEQLGVPRRIVSFVLPTGYTFNMDGTAIYLTLATVFVAQAAGVDMPMSRQFLLLLTLTLTSKGVAGVPRTGLVVLAGALAQFNLPVEGVALILGVDAVMDMARTSVNLLGNCLATVVLARWEGEVPAAAERVEEPAAHRMSEEESRLASSSPAGL